ncbi:enoyl-CoA hydratase/isomerase family protein [Streptomyces sp. INA 01156]
MAITLTRERNGCVAHIRYDNAARGDGFDGELLGELVDTLEAAALDPMCSVIRLDMAGRHFCGGWDTTSFGDLSASTTESVAAALRSSDEMLGRIRRLPVPVVAGVRGQVIGFGAGLLSAVHLPVAAADTRLSLPEVRFGFAPRVWGTPSRRRCRGLRRTRSSPGRRLRAAPSFWPGGWSLAWFRRPSSKPPSTSWSRRWQRCPARLSGPWSRSSSRVWRPARPTSRTWPRLARSLPACPLVVCDERAVPGGRGCLGRAVHDEPGRGYGILLVPPGLVRP